MISAEDVLIGLDDDQRAAATALHGPVVIIAGAGSGKTRAITRRIAYGVHTGAHDPARSVAVTFTTKAAGEMSRRLRELGVPGVRVSTFHAAALRQLRFYWPRYMGSDLPEIAPAKAPLVGAAASARRASTDRAAVRDLSAEIEWAKVNGLTPEAYENVAQERRRTPPAGLSVGQFAEVFAEYERRKDAAGRIDFEDVLLLMAALLESEPRVAAHLRPALRHVTVDEYQDVSPLQQRVLDGWLGGNEEICVVGDPEQTIYTFAGADAGYLTGFQRRYPDATVVQLPRTYRCSPEIATAANRLLAGSRMGVRLASQQEPGPAVRITEYADVEAEAEAVAERISAVLRSGPDGPGLAPDEIAVLVRMNSMTEPFEEALAARGIGYRVSGSTGFFARPDVRKAIAVIRGAAMSAEEGGDVVGTVGALLAGMGWTAEPPVGTGALREKWESYSALHEAARQFVATHPGATLVAFAADLNDRAARQDAPDAAGVTLASLHSAKGQEWSAVFLVGLVEGVLPHAAAETDTDIAEERRLFYVGLTRAARLLELSYPRTRSGKGRPRTPSRFLRSISDKPMDLPAPPAGGRTARRKTKAPSSCRVCGKALTTGAERSLSRCSRCPGDVDAALLERLREWRSQTVEALSAEKPGKLPAYLVATDATLMAIAEQRPGTVEALADIPGIGPRKVDDYGEALVALVRASAEA